MMIKLSDSLYVSADMIQRVSIDGHGANRVTVRMKDGEVHSHSPIYGQSVYKAQDELIAKINHALESPK